jgi:hypothetical protein
MPVGRRHHIHVDAAGNEHASHGLFLQQRDPILTLRSVVFAALEG